MSKITTFAHNCMYSSHNQTFPAKLLLFGEHILLKGASALAVPVPHFYGYWKSLEPGDPEEQWLQLKSAISQLDPSLEIDFNQLAYEVQNGLFFASNIPQGYGLGSSGALCAAIYRRYARQPLTAPAALKSLLGKMESSFHGKSSGIDPLTSYLGKPVLIQGNELDVRPEMIFPVGIHVFLADTGMRRQTGTLVNWFLEQCETSDFYDTLKYHIFPMHETMLHAWFAADTNKFCHHLANISKWQFQTLSPMLPNAGALYDWWASSLDNPTLSFKICGAGGGGFLLGFTTDPEGVICQAAEKQIPILFPFHTPVPNA